MTNPELPGYNLVVGGGGNHSYIKVTGVGVDHSYIKVTGVRFSSQVSSIGTALAYGE